MAYRKISKSDGAVRPHERHGMSETRTYQCWAAMVGRCHNPNNDWYTDYGARGITVCDQWRFSFVAFFEDMGECPKGLTIDRQNNNLGYFKGNCHWATDKDQARNRRANVHLTHNGETKTIAEWEEQLGMPAWAIGQRIKKGWTVAQAIETPIGGRVRRIKGLECAHDGKIRSYGKDAVGRPRLRCDKCGRTWVEGSERSRVQIRRPE